MLCYPDEAVYWAEGKEWKLQNVLECGGVTRRVRMRKLVFQLLIMLMLCWLHHRWRRRKLMT